MHRRDEAEPHGVRLRGGGVQGMPGGSGVQQQRALRGEPRRGHGDRRRLGRRRRSGRWDERGRRRGCQLRRPRRALLLRRRMQPHPGLQPGVLLAVRQYRPTVLRRRVPGVERLPRWHLPVSVHRWRLGDRRRCDQRRIGDRRRSGRWFGDGRRRDGWWLGDGRWGDGRWLGDGRRRDGRWLCGRRSGPLGRRRSVLAPRRMPRRLVPRRAVRLGLLLEDVRLLR